MKKRFLGILAAVLLLTAGTGALAAGRGACRMDGSCRIDEAVCRCVDRDGDGICDLCGKSAGSGCRWNYVDADGDGICDRADACLRSAGGGHHGGGHHR